MNLDNSLLRYKIRKKIGTGGMASVFLANDTLLNREVALKMVHPHLLHHPETMKRFANEARAIAALSHENIIKIFDFGEARSRPFLVMEYINGITLEALIAREGTIPNIVTIEIALQVLSGLICAHEKGVYHRDIKPGNILVDDRGCLHITDFGIAYLVNSESVTLTGSFLGSPHYISPEQVSNKTVSGTTDVFSLGIVLYQCLTGTAPFYADTPHGVINAILTVDPPCPGVKNSRILFWLSDIIESCLIKDSSKRPGSRELFIRLESTCRTESIRTGKDRIAAFVNNRAAARAAEVTEIFTLYRESALTALRRRHTATALRSFEQASLFGTLAASDRKLIDRVTRQSFIRRSIMIGSAAVLGTVLLILTAAFIFKLTLRSPRLPADPAMPQPIKTVGRDDVKPPSVPNRQLPFVIPIDTGSSASGSGAAATKNRRSFSPRAAEPSSPQPDKGTPAAHDAPAPPPAGFFKCFTNPPWVTIYIDDIERGTTPTLSAVPLSPGKHVLRLVKQQFAVIKDTVDIVPAETVLVRIRLTPERTEAVTP
ncbi:MAG: serine/threonine protein kinase [Chitinispirillaceae bacterium]|nr:serine/threonine protein kinase [Chitinispirillaceae bacterium]